jgi:ligand-binding sensor domain-containing protein
MTGSEDGVEIFDYDDKKGFTSFAKYPLRASPASLSKIYRIRHGEGSDLWLSGSDGLAQFSGIDFKLQEQSGPARDAVVFRKAVWIARSHGIEVYEPVLSKLSEMPILLQDGSETSGLTGTRQPLSILTVNDSTLLVGTQFGLLVATHSGTSLHWKHLYGKWDRVMGESIFQEPGNCPLPGNQVYNLRLSPDGKYVAACTDKGLAVFDSATQKNWTIYQGVHRVNRGEPGRGIIHREIKGEVAMPSSDITDVAFGREDLYLATRKGLVVVSRKGPKARPALVLGLDEGLPSSQVTGLEFDAKTKTLLVATRYGLATFRVP